jgi:Zn-dependent peptidase ImmA (M78 family)
MSVSDLQIGHPAYCTFDNTCQSSTWPGEQASLSDKGSVTDARAHALRERRQTLFADEGLPVPVEAIAEDLLGLAVERADLDGVAGLLYPAERRILLNANDIPARRRFTLAHELGHWVCQCLEGREAPVFCRTEDISTAGAERALEREANVFAAELLMPESEVRRSFQGSLADIAAAFGVSPDAMSWRLYNFGLVDERPA